MDFSLWLSLSFVLLFDGHLLLLLTSPAKSSGGAVPRDVRQLDQPLAEGRLLLLPPRVLLSGSEPAAALARPLHELLNSLTQQKSNKGRLKKRNRQLDGFLPDQ